MKRILTITILALAAILAQEVYSQSSGTTVPPPPYCTSSNAGAIYTDTATSPATVYTCSYYNLAWNWVVNPSYGGLVYYPTLPSTCSGYLPAFLSGWPTTKMYVCQSGIPVQINEGVTSITPAAGLTCLPMVAGSCSGNVTVYLSSAFAISSFTGCGGTLEVGQSIAFPTCSATYSAPPTRATITNSDSIDSPLVMTSPFTSATISGSFSHSTSTTTTITLTAIGSSTQTATQVYSWVPRIFGGVGAAGATSSISARGTTAVLSNGSVLSSAGLGIEHIGQTFGPFSPSGQNVYLLLTGSTHTFTDALTGFAFTFNAPTTVTFVNQYGATVTMYLYQSTNALTGTFEPKIGS